MSILHCTLENGADLYVNERHKIRQDCARSTKEKKRKKKKKKKKNAKLGFLYFARCVCKMRYIAILYTHSIGNQP